METLLSRSLNIRHLGPHNHTSLSASATRPTLEKQSVSSFIHFNGKPAFLSTARPNGGHEHETQFINRNQIDKVGSPSKGLAITALSTAERLLHEEPRKALGVVFELAETGVAEAFIERSCLKLERIEPYRGATPV